MVGEQAAWVWRWSVSRISFGADFAEFFQMFSGQKKRVNQKLCDNVSTAGRWGLHGKASKS